MKKTYPLLHAQTGILMACRKQPQCTRYNLPSAIPFSKKVEPGRLEEALRRVVECRPALRTRLVIDAEGRVRQYSDPGLRMDIVRRTMGEKQLTDYLNDGFVRPFRPFGQEPLCRFEVVETESHVWLLMDFHHIIADGFTLARNLMGRDLPAAYDGKTVDVEPRTLYDAAETEEQQEDSMAYCAARDYYGQLFRDVTFTSLPSPAAPAVDAATSASVWLARKGVDNWCRDHQVQPNWLFMAAFCIVMAKLSRQPQVAFATLSHGRFDRKLRDAYGMFVRTVPFVVDVDAEEETLDFIRRLRRPLMESVRHATYPYTHFCKDLRQSASVTFAFQGGDIMEEVALGGETVKGIQLPKEAADNELNCLVYSHRTDYEIRVDTGVEQLDAATVKMVAHAMEVCVDSIMSHPHADIDNFVRKPLDHHQAEPVLRCDRVKRFREVLPDIPTIVLYQECFHFCDMLPLGRNRSDRVCNRCADALPVVVHHVGNHQCVVIHCGHCRQRFFDVAPGTFVATGKVLADECRHQPVPVRCIYHIDRPIDALPPDFLRCFFAVVGNDGRDDHSKTVLGGNGLQRLLDFLPSEVFPFVVHYDNERGRIIKDELFQSFGDPAHRVFAQGFLPSEDGRARDAPVDDFRSRPVWLFQSAAHHQTVRIPMCRCWPHDWFAIAPGDQEEPLPGGRRSVIAGPQFLVFHPVAVSLQGIHKPPERFSYAAPIRMTVLSQRPPSTKLFHVFQHDYARPDNFGPFHCNPCKGAYGFALRFPAFCLTEMCAVR